MAKKIEENFLTSNIFLFESYGCDCEMATISENISDTPLPAIKIVTDTTRIIRFAFGSKVGLVRLNDDGSIAESNILGKLAAISPNNFAAYSSFFSRNGFLFPTSTTKPEFVGMAELQLIVDRLRATLELVSTITDMSRTSYEKIIRMIFYHLFAPIVSIETKDNRYKYSSNKHKYSTFLELHKDDVRDSRLNDTFNNEFFSFEDSLGNITLNADFVDSVLNNIITDSKYDSPLFHEVFSIYCSPRNDKPKTMLFINDFVFHYLYEVGVVDYVDLDNIHYIDDSIDRQSFSNQIKAAAVKTAKYIIKEEIETNLQRVHPTYDTNKLEPSWKIDSLLSALYFGLFYMRPNMENYRRCANPKCNQFFLVPISSRKKKYCCTACMNREMAARKRSRDKLRETL